MIGALEDYGKMNQEERIEETKETFEELCEEAKFKTARAWI